VLKLQAVFASDRRSNKRPRLSHAILREARRSNLTHELDAPS